MAIGDPRSFRRATCWGVLLTAAVVVTVIVSSVRAAVPAPHVALEQGTLEGTANNGYDEFLGIPFAEAPIGNLRWAPPAAPARWQGIRQAVKYQSKCVQDGLTRPLVEYRNEDCLYLNVYRPHSQATKKPVIVWIYGGGYVYGSSQDVEVPYWRKASARSSLR
jgi:para-nitrobenzyl esterase